MIEVKISSDMPLPMPRSVISSPSHMMTAVPAVIVTTIVTMTTSDSFGTRSLVAAREQRARVAGDRDQAGGLQDRQARRSGSGCTG